jgi:hypothetical protein
MKMIQTGKEKSEDFDNPFKAGDLVELDLSFRLNTSHWVAKANIPGVIVEIDVNSHLSSIVTVYWVTLMQYEWMSCNRLKLYE